LVVYLVIMLADWLQGTNMYTLYSVSFSISFLNLVAIDKNNYQISFAVVIFLVPHCH
jgi:hypothetical protein